MPYGLLSLLPKLFAEGVAGAAASTPSGTRKGQCGGGAARERRRDHARRAVERDHPCVAVEYDRGIRQARDHVVEGLLRRIRLFSRKRGIRVCARAVEPAGKRFVSLAYHDRPVIVPHRYDFGATPSHNSRTPRMTSDNANG